MPSTSNPTKLGITSGQLFGKGAGNETGKLANIVRGNRKGIAINARKITILKNIQKLKGDPIGAKLPGGGGLTETLGSIAATVESIKNTLIGQQEVDKQAIEDEKQNAETAARAKKENKLESKIFSTLKTQGEKIIAPVKSLWSKIWDFFVKLFAGKVLMNVLEWFGDKKNTDKIKSMIRFVSDWWPAILGSIGVLLGGLLIVGGGPIAAMIGAAMFLAGALTPVIAALGIFGGGDAKKLEQQKRDLEKGLNDVDDGGGEQNVNVEDQIQTDEEVLNEVQFRNEGGLISDRVFDKGFNKGGSVPGSGNSDTVPAMLTPGEFVMSKGAVLQYGVDTLSNMNAAAGGTNRPTLMGGFNQGGFANLTNTMTTSSSDSAGNFSMGLNYVGPEEAKVFLAERGFPSMELSDGTVVPNFGRMTADKMTGALQSMKGMMIQNGASPERIAQIDGLISNPNAQPEFVANAINQIVPGSMANVAATESARFNRMQFSSGGLVLGFQGGGQVQPQIKGNSKTPTINPPPTIVKNSGGGGLNKVTQINNKGKEGGKGDVPSIDAAAMRDREKISVLGITV